VGTIDYAVSKKDAGPNSTKDNDGKIKKNQNEESIEARRQQSGE